MKVHVNEAFRRLLPSLSGDEFAQLEANCIKDGIREAIIVRKSDGAIVDGHNRYDIATAHGLTFRRVEKDFEDDNATMVWMIRNQTGRRNLTESQRGLLAGQLERLSVGRPNKIVSVDTITKSEAAEMFSVSQPTVARARRVHDKGTPELVEAVRDGKVSLRAASEVATLPKSEQKKIVNEGGDAIREAARKVRESKPAAPKKPKRTITKPAPIEPEIVDTTEWPAGQYRILYANPDWSKSVPVLLAEDRTYERMMDDSACFIWAAPSMLDKAMTLMQRWGFTCAGSIAWVKPEPSQWTQGDHMSERHELLLYGIQGDCKPESNKQGSVLENTLVLASNQKPSQFRALIDCMYPIGPRAEAFAPGSTNGWKAPVQPEGVEHVRLENGAA